MKNGTLVFAVMFLLAVSSCTKKKETNTIITKIETPKVSREIRTVGDNETRKSFDWNGTVYEAVVTRKADKELPVVKDEDGNRYYDNSIEVSLSSAGSEVFRRVFHKSDFTSYINTGYLKPSKSALMSVAFTRVEGGNAMFVATIGSPDTMADEYMLVEISVSKSGGMTMSQIQETD